MFIGTPEPRRWEIPVEGRGVWNMDTVKDVLHATAFRKIDVENLLNPDNPSWVRFDPVLGLSLIHI